MKKICLFIPMAILLSGCVAANKPTPKNVVSPLPTSQVQSVPVMTSVSQSQDYASRLTQCRKELDAMQSYDQNKYQLYKVEFDKTAGQLKKYLDIKSGIGNDINDLAMPKYQFTLRDVCFRIKNDLATSIVKTI